MLDAFISYSIILIVQAQLELSTKRFILIKHGYLKFITEGLKFEACLLFQWS